MPVISEGNNLYDVLKWEGDVLYSRDAITVASGQHLTCGTVLGIQTVNGKAYALAPAAIDGTEIAVGFLIDDVDATSNDTKSAMIARLAIASDKGLGWPVGITAPQQKIATAQLKAIGIIIRQGV